jgi:hypothetical protein
MTKEEYEERCAPCHEMIAILRKRHAEELKPWFDRLAAINAYYIPPILIPREQWERLQMEQGIRSGSVSDRPETNGGEKHG